MIPPEAPRTWARTKQDLRWSRLRSTSGRVPRPAPRPRRRREKLLAPAIIDRSGDHLHDAAALEVRRVDRKTAAGALVDQENAHGDGVVDHEVERGVAPPAWVGNEGPAAREGVHEDAVGGRERPDAGGEAVAEGEPVVRAVVVVHAVASKQDAVPGERVPQVEVAAYVGPARAGRIPPPGCRRRRDAWPGFQSANNTAGRRRACPAWVSGAVECAPKGWFQDIRPPCNCADARGSDSRCRRTPGRGRSAAPFAGC